MYFEQIDHSLFYIQCSAWQNGCKKEKGIRNGAGINLSIFFFILGGWVSNLRYIFNQKNNYPYVTLYEMLLESCRRKGTNTLDSTGQLDKSSRSISILFKLSTSFSISSTPLHSHYRPLYYFPFCFTFSPFYEPIPYCFFFP